MPRWAKHIFYFSALIVFISFPCLALASESIGTINDSYKYAWGENLGWVNFNPSNGGLTITDTVITGFAWSKTYGWISFSPNNVSVTNNCSGQLGGSAWSSLKGWITMAGVTIDSSGKFIGAAGSSGTPAGRISFTCDSCDVRTDWRPCNSRTVVTPAFNPGGGGRDLTPLPTITTPTTTASSTVPVSEGQSPPEVTPPPDVNSPTTPPKPGTTPPPSTLANGTRGNNPAETPTNQPITSPPEPNTQPETGQPNPNVAPSLAPEGTKQPIPLPEVTGRTSGIIDFLTRPLDIVGSDIVNEVKKIINNTGPVGQEFVKIEELMAGFVAKPGVQLILAPTLGAIAVFYLVSASVLATLLNYLYLLLTKRRKEKPEIPIKRWQAGLAVSSTLLSVGAFIIAPSYLLLGLCIFQLTTYLVFRGLLRQRNKNQPKTDV